MSLGHNRSFLKRKQKLPKLIPESALISIIRRLLSHNARDMSSFFAFLLVPSLACCLLMTEIASRCGWEKPWK